MDFPASVHPARLSRKNSIFVVIACGWFFSIGIRYLFPALLPDLRTEFGLDLTTSGLLITAVWSSYALGQFPGGLLGDKIGGRNILVLSSAATLGTVLVISFSFNAYMIFLAAVLFGLASALYGPTRFTIFSHLFPNNTGTAVGVTMAFGNLANAVLPIVAGVLATYFSWRWGFGFVIPFFLPVVVALWFVVPGDVIPTNGDSDESLRDSVRNVASAAYQKSVLLMGSIQLCASFVGNGFKGFYPLFLIETKDISPVLATTLFGLTFAAATFIQPLSGVATDRIGSKPTVVATAVVTGSALVGITMVDELLYVVPLTLCLGAINGFSPVTQTFLTEAFPDDITSSGLGMVRTAFILLGSTGPLFVGWLADMGYFEESFVVLGGLALVPIVLVAVSGR